MGRIITIANQKGGVGKSTTALALSEILGSKGKRVLLIDLDSQGNSTFASGVTPGKQTITDVLSGDPAAAAVAKSKYYDVIPSDQYLGNVERDESINPNLIKNSIESLILTYDYIIIDTPPTLGNLMYGSLVAADYVIIPIEARPFSLQGLAALHNTIQSVQKTYNKRLTILGILLVKYHSRTVLNRDVRSMIAEYASQIGTNVLQTSIREGIAIPEAQIQQIPLIDYAVKSNPTRDYLELAEQILKEIGE